MTLRQYLINRRRRERTAEVRFELMMVAALEKTLQPLFEAIRVDLQGSLQSIDRILKSDEIEKALHWVYVDWAYGHGRWFINRVGIEKKQSIDLWLETLEAEFKLYGASKVTPILDTTKELARRQIVDALSWAQDGVSINDIESRIATNIKKEGGVISNGRIRTIARTEVMGASNVATHTAVAQSGAKTEHSWITGGANIRDSHLNAEANGWIPFDQPFNLGNGVKMMHPHAPGAPAEEVINCKCAEIFRVVD